MDRKVSELPEAQQINDDDIFMILQNNKNKKVTIDKLLSLMQTETITNANGTAIKFADGTMLEYGTYDTGITDFTTQFGSVFYNQSYSTINFPLAFVDIPSIVINQELGGYLGGNTLGGLPTKTNFRVYLYIAQSGVLNRNATIYWQAIRKMEIER